MFLSKQSRSSGAGSSVGRSSEVLRSQAREIAFRVYIFFKISATEDVRSRLNLSKCQHLRGESCGVHKSSVSGICRYSFRVTQKENQHAKK
jgi:hypothetical protein